MGHRIAVITFGIVMAGLVAGCSGGSGTPQPSSSASSSSSGGAPHVANPLDTSKFQAAPCTVLSTAEAEVFGASSPGQSKSDALGPSCVWRNRDSGTSFYVTFVTANKEGLSSLYRQRDTLGLFQELPPVQGYPAVIYGRIDGRSSGDCDIAVGVSDSLDYSVDVQASTGSFKTDPCGAAQQIAMRVLEHLKNGSS